MLNCRLVENVKNFLKTLENSKSKKKVACYHLENEFSTFSTLNVLSNEFSTYGRQFTDTANPAVNQLDKKYCTGYTNTSTHVSFVTSVCLHRVLKITLLSSYCQITL